MRKFETLALKILNESPVGVNSKQQWVSSILHRLALNSPSTNKDVVSAFKKKYPEQTYHDTLDTDKYYYKVFADELANKLDFLATNIAAGAEITPQFIADNIQQIIEKAGITPSSTIGSTLVEILKDTFQAKAERGETGEVIISSTLVLPFVVEAIVDKMFDVVFAQENTEIEDYHASREVEDRQGMSGKYAFANPAQTDKEWDDFILHALKKVLPLVARDLKIRFTPNKNILSYTARITAQAQEAIAYTFPMQRTGMGRGSGGDKRRGEEIMSASANKREMVARSTAAVEDAEEFNKYDYIFNNTNEGLDDHEKELLETVLDSLPVKASGTRYTSTEVVQACIRNRVFTVPARVRAFIKVLLDKGIVNAVPVVKKATSSSDVDDLFD
jgi:hypothetical protein